MWANAFFVFVGILNFLRYFASFGPQEIEVGGFAEPFDLDFAIAYLVGGGIHLLIIYGLARARRWSKIVQKIVAIPYFFILPHGTLYTLLVYLSLNRGEMDTYFAPGKLVSDQHLADSNK